MNLIRGVCEPGSRVSELGLQGRNSRTWFKERTRFGTGSSVGDRPRERRPRRVEEPELGRTLAEDRARDQVAARQAECVAVARVAARDPDAVAHLADERHA